MEAAQVSDEVVEECAAGSFPGRLYEHLNGEVVVLEFLSRNADDVAGRLVVGFRSLREGGLPWTRDARLFFAQHVALAAHLQPALLPDGRTLQVAREDYRLLQRLFAEARKLVRALVFGGQVPPPDSPVRRMGELVGIPVPESA